jgi:flagellar motility protein MotE (MotC chaperone)
MKEILLISIMSFFLILFGALYTTGYLEIGPPMEREEGSKMEENRSLIRTQLVALEKLKEHVERKKVEIQSMENNLSLERKMLVDQRELLGNRLKEIENSFKQLEKDREKRVSSLADLYESMDPKQSAKIASSLDLDLLVEIVVKMKARQAAKMIEELPPSIGARISKKLGERGIK